MPHFHPRIPLQIIRYMGVQLRHTSNGSGVKMQNVVTVFFRILIYEKWHIFVQFLYEKIQNNVGYS